MNTERNPARIPAIIFAGYIVNCKMLVSISTIIIHDTTVYDIGNL